MSSSVRILYVEDDALERRAFFRMVHDRGLPWEIQEAGTLADARAHFAQSRFDVIIADYHLPDGESTEMFDEVQGAPFVLITGTLEEELALRTLERGADDYLAKDPESQYLQALPSAIQKTMYRKAIAERERRLTQELIENEQRLRTIFENAASGIMQIDDQDRIAVVNDRLCEMLGYAREELLGMSVHDLTYPPDRPRTKAVNARLHESLSPTDRYEKRYLRRDGTPLWVEVALAGVHDDAGRFLYSIGTVLDINKRKAAEAQVHLQAAALQAAPNAVSLSTTDEAGTIVWVNSAFSQLTGYSADEAIGNTHHILSSGHHDEAFYRELWETIKRGEVWRGELVNRRKDGTLYYEEMGITPLRDEEGNISHYVAVKQDITARKSAEAALRESEERFHTLADAVPLLIWQCGPDRSCEYFNKGWLEFTGRSIEQELGCGWIEGVHPDDANRCLETFTAAVERLESFEIEYRLLHHSGEYRWVLDRGRPRFAPDGTFMGYVGGCTDIHDRKKTEQALRDGEERLRLAQEAAHIGAFEWDIETGLNVWTPELEALHGLQPGEFARTQLAWKQLVHPDDRAEAVRLAEVAMQTGQPVEGEWRVVWPDGSLHWLAGRFQVFKDARGQPVRMIGVNFDITTRKQAEEAERASEEQYRVLVDSIPDHAIMMLDAKGNIRAWNPGAERIFRWTEAEILGQHFGVLCTPEDRLSNAPEQELEQATQFGRASGDRWQMRKDGTRFYGAGSIAPIRSEDGQPRSYVKVVSDATQQKLAERVLVESERTALAFTRSKLSRYGVAVLLSAASVVMLELMAPLFGIKGPPWVLTALAVAAAAWWGGIGPGLVTTAISAVFGLWWCVPPRYSFAVSDPAEITRWLLLIMSGVSISAIAGRMHRAANRQRLTVARLTLEIQERRRIEAAVREQAEMLDQSYDAAFAWPLHGAIRYWNSGAERVYGYSRAEAIGHLPHELLHTLVENGTIESMRSVLERDGHWTGELHQVTREGRELILESRMALVRDGAGGDPLVIESNRDITYRKRAEDALRESEQKFRALAENAPTAIGIVQGTRFVYANRRFTDLSGYSMEELLAMEFPQLVHVDYRDMMIERAQRRLRGEPVPSHYEFLMVRNDGEPRWVDFSPALIDYGGAPAIIGAGLDVTDRKRAEEALAAANRSAERAKAAAEDANAAKDRFLAVLSHELRTPLTPALAAVSMLQKNQLLDERTKEDLEMIRRNVELEGRLIDDLLDLTRIARGKIELDKHAVELCSVINRAVEVCRPDIEARQLEFGVDIGPDAPYVVEADVARLQQVFWNLLKNSIKFTPHGGCVGIRCRLDDRGGVIVEVNDSGIGIEPEALPRIFNAFAQADRAITRQFGGLGLGLAISKSLVEMHGGHIEAHSRGKGKGASFKVRLPLASTAALTPARPEPPELRQQRVLHLLVVEDHSDTAEMLKIMLEMEGHQVETAGDVETALEKTQQGDFDMLISDLGLPDGSGLDLMRELRRRGNRLPGIALSGYGQEADVQQSRAVGFAAHVTKPIDTDKLVAVLADITNPSTGAASSSRN